MSRKKTKKVAKSRRLTQAERTAESTARMIREAIDQVVEHGVEHMTLKEVGEAAGYSRGLASLRFGSKKNLVVSVISSISDERISKLKGLVQEQVGLDAICELIDAHYEFCIEASNATRAFYLLWFESINPASLSNDIVVGIYNRRKEVIVDWVEQGIEKELINPAVSPETVAELFGTAIVGITWRWLVDPMNKKEIRKLHEGLKEVMTALLSPSPMTT